MGFFKMFFKNLPQLPYTAFTKFGATVKYSPHPQAKQFSKVYSPGGCHPLDDMVACNCAQNTWRWCHNLHVACV